MGLVWRLEAFQKGPGTKGTRMEECKKNAKARGEGDEGGKKMQKKCKHKRKQNAKKNANNMRRKFGNAKKHAKKRNQNAKTMQKKSNENATTCKKKHSVFAVFPIFQDQPRMRPAPTHLGCIIFAFFCILFAFFFCIIFAFFLPPSSPSPLAFAFFLHSSMRVPFAPGPFWKASSLQTNPMIHDPQLGGGNSVCG